MAFTETATQAIAIMDYILPTNAAAASFNSASPIDMSKFKRAMYIIEVGAVVATGTLDARLQSSATNFGTAHNISTTNIVQVTASNTIVTIEVRADQITGANAGDRYLRLNTTVGTTAVNYGAIGIGYQGEQKPEGANYNPTAVAAGIVCTL